MRSMLLLLASLLALSACGPEEKWASDAAVTRASYRDPGPSSITLYTMVSNDTGAGGHSALMINGSERVLYDPAGSWNHPAAPERNDLHYGFTPWQQSFYIDYHARTTYHVVEQTLTVPQETADALIRSVMQQGAAPKAYCTRYNSTALKRVPGFEGIGVTWYPVNLMEQFAEIPGVRTRKIYDDDPAYNRTMLEAGIVPVAADAFTAAN
jgi:hypothetical protein